MLLQILVGFLAIGLGALFLFLGYRAFIILLPIGGFVAGFILGAELIASVLEQGFLATLTGWIVGIAAGLIMAALAYFFYSFGVILLSGMFGLLLAAGLAAAIGIESDVINAIVVIGGAVLGIALAIYLDIKKYLVIFITAVGGAVVAVTGFMLLFDRIAFEDLQSGGDIIQDVVSNSFLWLLVWIAFGILGIAVQVITTKDFMIDSDLGYIGRPEDLPG